MSSETDHLQELLENGRIELLGRFAFSAELSPDDVFRWHAEAALFVVLSKGTVCDTGHGAWRAGEDEVVFLRPGESISLAGEVGTSALFSRQPISPGGLA